MKIPKLRLVLLTFLPSVFSCFVVTACTSEQPKQTVGSVTPTVTATPTPKATGTATETPTPTYTSTPTPEPRSEYECSRNGVQPSIPGSIYRDGDCFIPISAGKCIAYRDPHFGDIMSDGPSGMTKCDNPQIVSDEATGKKDYRFFERSKFILE